MKSINQTNNTEKVLKSCESSNSTKEPFFSQEQGGVCGIPHIYYTFKTLIERDFSKFDKTPTSWYKCCSLDRSDASKIKRGLLIPPLYVRLKISRYFGIDSSQIWRREDIAEIRKLLQKQRRAKK